MKSVIIVLGFLTILPSLAADKAEMIKKGEYLFNLSGCLHCHTADHSKPLAGGAGIPTPFGTFFAPNITMDRNTGIGAWSDQQFIRALRDGRDRMGNNYYPVFPYSSYTKLSTEDILSIKAYIETLPAVEQKNKNHEIGLLYQPRVFVNSWKFFNLQSIQKPTAKNFFKGDGAFKSIEGKDAAWNRGAYLVEGAMHCAQCHSPRTDWGNFVWDRWMGGSKIAGGKKAAPNLTSSTTKGLGKWTAEDWELFLTDGMSPDGNVVSGEMGLVIEKGTSQLTGDDRKAVIKYLMSMPAVD